jgi:general secretion pathway protein K
MKYGHLILEKNQAGVALVTVLWFLALLMVMTASYSVTMRTETRLTANHVHTAQAKALAEAGIWIGVSELLRPESDSNWRADGSVHQVFYSEGSMNISLQDESGLVDLNTASDDLILALLQSTGLDDNQALLLQHRILDWRDRDKLVRTYGAEDNEYEMAGYEYGAKDGPFNTVDELRELMGMTEPVFQAIRHSLTVYSHKPAINPAVAPQHLVKILADQKADDGSQSRAGGIPGQLESLANLNNPFLSSTRGVIYTVKSQGVINNSKQTIEAVVLLKKNVSPPYSVLSWR